MGAGIAAILAAGALATSAPPNPIQVENAQPGADPASWIQPAYTATSIAGYSSEISVLPGQIVHLHVRTSAGQRYRVEIYRLGWYGGSGARLLACLPSCGGDEGSQPYGTTDGFRADWPVTDAFTVPETRRRATTTRSSG
jgi:hypothetical protein